MRFSLEWHRECEKNQATHLAQKEAEAAETLRRLEVLRKSLAFYRAQIAEAEARGIDSFDSEKLLVRSKPST